MNKKELQMLSFWRKRGMVPDWWWYQVNGQSAEQNLEEQKYKLLDEIGYFDNSPEYVKIIFESKVKNK